jgi:hypothetical protein
MNGCFKKKLFFLQVYRAAVRKEQAFYSRCFQKKAVFFVLLVQLGAGLSRPRRRVFINKAATFPVFRKVAACPFASPLTLPGPGLQPQPVFPSDKFLFFTLCSTRAAEAPSWIPSFFEAQGALYILHRD